MQHRSPDSLPKSVDSALCDKLECLYNLLYLVDRMAPSAGASAENPQLQQHLNSIRTHLDAMRSILGHGKPPGSQRSQAADAA